MQSVRSCAMFRPDTFFCMLTKLSVVVGKPMEEKIANLRKEKKEKKAKHYTTLL